MKFPILHSSGRFSTEILKLGDLALNLETPGLFRRVDSPVIMTNSPGSINWGKFFFFVRDGEQSFKNNFGFRKMLVKFQGSHSFFAQILKSRKS